MAFAPASRHPATAAATTATYTVVGRSSRIARCRTQSAHVAPSAWCRVQDSALAYPPTTKKTGMTWNTRVPRPDQPMSDMASMPDSRPPL